MTSSGLRKMLFFISFQHWMVYEYWCVLWLYGHSDILLLYFMADVMPYVCRHIVCLGICYCHICGRCCCHIMCGRCYNHQADGTACCWARWQMLLPLYCMSQMFGQLSMHVANCYVADVFAKVADGIAYQAGYRSIGRCYCHKWQVE